MMMEEIIKMGKSSTIHDYNTLHKLLQAIHIPTNIVMIMRENVPRECHRAGWIFTCEFFARQST